jgi:hypothetical protein
MILSNYIRIHGEGRWRNLAHKAGLMRCGKSCRQRWLNYLRPDIKLGNISPDEDELIIRLHRLLGNRWSLIAGRLPGRTDNEIKNYWNSQLGKKMLIMTQSEQIGTKNLKTRSKSAPLRNSVLKTIPVRIKTAVKPPEMVRLNGSNGYGYSHFSSDEAFKLYNDKEANKSSKPTCDLLVNDAIISDDSDRIACAASYNLVETEARSCTVSMSSLADERSPHSYYFAGLPESLLNLNELSSPDCKLLSSPSDSGSEMFCRERATLAMEMNEFEVMYSDQNNGQSVNSFTDASDHGMEDFFHNTHQVDWIHKLDLPKTSPRFLDLLLLEPAEEWEE